MTTDIETNLGATGVKLINSRGLEIRTKYGRLHFDRSDGDLEHCIQLYRKRQQSSDGSPISDDEPLVGTVVRWENGREVGESESLSVLLASIAELAAKKGGRRERK